MNNHLKHIDNKLFAERLKTERERKCIPQTQMANELGIPKSSLSYYESGNAIPSLDKTYELAEYLHVSLDYLVGREEVSGKAISSLGDLARLILRLCEYHGIELRRNIDSTPYIAISLPELSDFFDRQMDMSETLENLEVEKEVAVRRMMEENLRYRLLEMDNVQAIPDFNNGDTQTADDCSEHGKITSIPEKKKRGRKPKETLASAADTINDPQENRPKITTEE